MFIVVLRILRIPVNIVGTLIVKRKKNLNDNIVLCGMVYNN